ncbi:hypothetical protein D3C80_1688020 [compost metagenome]
MIGDQEEPVAAPGDIADHPADARHLQCQVLAITVGRHVAHADRVVFVQGRLHGADRGFDTVHTRPDAAQVRQ